MGIQEELMNVSNYFMYIIDVVDSFLFHLKRPKLEHDYNVKFQANLSMKIALSCPQGPSTLFMK